MKEVSQGHGESAGMFFKTSAEFWMNLQKTCDLRNAEKALPARARKSIQDTEAVSVRRNVKGKDLIII
jgi:plasmid maintenance system antidote protein VapI